METKTNQIVKEQRYYHVPNVRLPIGLAASVEEARKKMSRDKGIIGIMSTTMFVRHIIVQYLLDNGFVTREMIDNLTE